MAAVLNEVESESFNSWLDQIAASSSADASASIVGGSSLVFSHSAPGDWPSYSAPRPRSHQVQSFPGTAYPSAHQPSAFPPSAYPDPASDQAHVRQARMATQTRELEAWLHSGIANQPHLPQLAPPARQPTRSYSEERPARSTDDTMALLAQAELRAGLGARGGQGGYSAHSGLSASSMAPSVGRPPPVYTQPPPLAPASASRSSPPRPFQPPPKRRATAARPPPPPPPSHGETSNPAPSRTPANIPSSTYTPPFLAPPVPPPVPRPPPSNSLTGGGGGGGGGKPVLLTAAQKKANHIASEQKRRAAIRNGYEGLCTAVPALRAAVEEFDERVRTAGARKKGDKRRGGGGAGSGALMGGIDVGGEKIDGRAGPKSEAVVLGKTVDHVRALLHSRTTLLARLSAAYVRTADEGVHVPGGRTVWDEHWDDRTGTGGDGGDFADDDGEWSEDD